MQAALVIFTCAAVAALLAADHRGAERLKWVFKPAASAGFVAFALASGALETGYGLLILAGLVLCLVGDVLLISRASRAFLTGMGAFALGHLAYAGAFLHIGGPITLATFITAAVIGALVLLILRWLWPHLGDFRAPVAVYCLIISAMVVAALATAAPDGSSPYWIAAAGAIGFAASDISVARDQFVRQEFFNRLWGLPLYYGSQLLIAASVSL